MGKNTFTITFEDGTSASQSIFIAEPAIVKGWWSSDKEGEKILEESKLGETVFYHVETKGIANGQKLDLKLYDNDFYIHPLYYILKNDDDEFPDEEVIRRATIRTVKGRKCATVELLLSEKWESVIKDDIDMTVNLDKKIELHWEVKYGTKLKTRLDSSFLHVGFSDKTLYFKSPTAGHNLPEFISYDGSPLLLMKLGGKILKDEVQKKVGNIIGKSIDKTISNIALTKMEKGSLVTNTGQIYTKNSSIYTKDIFTNDGKLLKDIKQRKNFGFKQGEEIVSSKGLSQYDYFSTTGKRVKLLGFLKSASHLFDFASLLNSAKDGFDTSKPLSIPMGPLSPINDLAGVLIQQYADDLDETLEMVLQEELAMAKKEGLKGIQQFVYNNSNSKKNKYDLMAVSAETVGKLIQGEFKTFDELKYYTLSCGDESNLNLQVLYREVYNKNRKDDMYIIETIFIDE